MRVDKPGSPSPEPGSPKMASLPLSLRANDGAKGCAQRALQLDLGQRTAAKPRRPTCACTPHKGPSARKPGIGAPHGERPNVAAHNLPVPGRTAAALWGRTSASLGHARGTVPEVGATEREAPQKAP